MYFLDYPDLKHDKSRMEHFTSLCGVLFDFLGEMSLPNSAELIGLYGRVCIKSAYFILSDIFLFIDVHQ